METIAERLKFARASKGWTQGQLAAAAGVSQGTIGNIESGARQAKASLIEICEALNVDYKWLSTGVGVMAKTDSIGLPERVSNIDFSIPLLSWARAGAFCEAAGQFTLEDAEEMLPRPLQSMGKNTFALTVRGDSMDMPDGYREGEIVYIDPSVDPTPGRDVLAKTDAGYTLKRYKEDESGPYLLQLNGNKIIRPDTHWSVCGVVVFAGRKR